MSDLDARVAALIERLRASCLSVRNKSAPLANLIPLMQESADAFEAIRAELQKPALHESVTDRAAIEAACRFIEEKIASRQCDNDGVASCWRCNSVYLAKRMRDLLTAHDLQGQAKPAQEEKIPPELENYSRFLDKQMDEIAQEEITDAERYQALKVRAHFVDESGGWSGHFRIANIPARETGPWAKSHGGEYDHKTLDEAINALIRASKGEKT